MMNGLEQSDLAIVPMRAANKGTSVPAEPTEGRAGTKGNPRGQSTHRTQRRARVSQAAERIREAATRKPKEKLTALLHHITAEALDAAYCSLKKEAAAGVDGVTWHEYGKGLAERLSALHDRVSERSVPGASVAAGRDTEAGRGNTTAGHRRIGGQDCPEGGGGDHPFADIRAGVPRIQLWVPTRTWGA